jgi:hypothetical protein
VSFLSQKQKRQPGSRKEVVVVVLRLKKQNFPMRFLKASIKLLA